MINAVFDTNIYISALHFNSRIPRRLLESADKGNFLLIISPQILAELRGVLRVKFGYSPQKLDLLEELLKFSCKIVDPKIRVRVVKDDPDDDKIIECAIDGEAVVIVSGDRHLLKLKSYKGIRIINPREFWENYLKLIL